MQRVRIDELRKGLERIRKATIRVIATGKVDTASKKKLENVAAKALALQQMLDPQKDPPKKLLKVVFNFLARTAASLTGQACGD